MRALEEMSQGLALLERELELNAQPLSRLLERGAERSRGPAEELFRDCLQGLNHLDREDFSSLWRRLVSGCHALGSEGQAVLFPLGDTLGRYEEELSARLEEDSRRRGRVYQALGLSGGAFLVILLL